MKKLLLLLASLSCIQSFAQMQLMIASGTQGFGNNWDAAASVTYDTQENIYVTGYFASDSITFGNITLHNQGGADMYIVKYDLVLNVQWALSIGGSGGEYGQGITADSSNNIIVVGNFESASIVMGNDTLVNHAAGTPDMFIARIDVNGNFLWARNEGGTNYDNCGGVDMNPVNGDIYVAGAYYLSDMIIENDTFVNRGGYDMILMKFDLAGNYLWAQDGGGNLNDLGNGVAWDASSNHVVVSGGFAGDSLIFPNGDTLVNAFSGQPDIFVVKYDPSGNFVWSRRAGAADNDHSVSVDVDGNGQVYVAGHYHSLSFVVGNDTLVNQGMGDAFLIAYDINGNPLWAKTAGGMDHDFGYHVWVDNGNRIYFSGMYMSSSITFGSFTHNNMMMGMEDLFLTMYAPWGFESGSLTGGGMGADYVASLVSNIAGIYMVGGFTSTTLWAGSATLTNTDPSGNTGDAMVLTSFIPLNMTEPIDENNFSVYPNPGTGVFNFVNPQNENVRVEIFNAIGQQVYISENNSAATFAVDLSGEPAGIYFAKMLTAEGFQTFTLIVE
ncbi:MAG TPA: T9SS type A sorting domain-containing protein [Bacteroidia bacterium]|nr:T9SS type A sorting domain-containing protein [Bacteroidia bacterium]